MAAVRDKTLKPVLELDSELGARLAPDERDHARKVKVAVLGLRPGPWELSLFPYGAAEGTSAGFLVAEGLMVRETELAETRSAELLAPGDIVLEPSQEHVFLPATPVWTVLTRGRVGLLDRRFVRAAGRSPGLGEAVMARAAERAERLATQHAIAQLPRVDLRILALLWHLTERTGRVGREGVILPVPLTHELLGRLVGARRPTVSLALKELTARGHVSRHPEGWQLSQAMPELAAELPPGRPARKAPEAPPSDPVDLLAQSSLRRVERMRAEREAAATRITSSLNEMESLRDRLAALRAHSEELRAQAQERKRAREG